MQYIFTRDFDIAYWVSKFFTLTQIGVANHLLVLGSRGPSFIYQPIKKELTSLIYYCNKDCK